MAQFAPKLLRLFLIKGISRALLPLAILWGIFDWYYVSTTHAIVFAALTINYVIVYTLSWVAPALMNGPWRIRPWQTFVILINAVALPIVFYNTCGRLPFGFIAMTVLALTGLFVSTAIHLHLQERLPMSACFAYQRQNRPPGTPMPTTTPVPATVEADTPAPHSAA